jgi:hypothetical protein
VGELYSLSTSALGEGGWSAPRPGRFTPGKTQYPLYRRLGGPQGRSGRVRKISPHRDLFSFYCSNSIIITVSSYLQHALIFCVYPVPEEPPHVHINHVERSMNIASKY